MQAIDNLNQRLFKAQEEYQREVGVVDEMKQTVTVLNSQVKVSVSQSQIFLAKICFLDSKCPYSNVLQHPYRHVLQHVLQTSYSKCL